MLLRYYRYPALQEGAATRVLNTVRQLIGPCALDLATELCFYLEVEGGLSRREQARLRWLLADGSGSSRFGTTSFLRPGGTLLKIGPLLNFETTWSSQAVAICHRSGRSHVRRIEQFMRYRFSQRLTHKDEQIVYELLHDRMTQVRYDTALTTFAVHAKPEPVKRIPVLTQGLDALQKANKRLGLSMDQQDLEMYEELFVNVLKRNPTDVELFQLGQANSEHSRHHFFRGRLVIDGQQVPRTLMDIVKEPWRVNPGNSLLAFCDDSSALRGGEVLVTIPESVDRPSRFSLKRIVLHPTLTAETHNFPSGVAPFPGAETGTGGRIRDNQAVGRGGAVIAAGAAYCVGNLHIPHYDLPWEEDGWQHPAGLASPLEILIKASNGASDYGNKFGEPVICGFTRSFGMTVNGEYRSWLKPIMYTVGAGQLADAHILKGDPEAGMLVVQIGGPAYRIGMGGGSASSRLQGEGTAELDFSAVQRGDAEMEQRVHRFIRACTELDRDNPIVSIHDLGAGGDCNALPELVHPAGACIDLRAIPVGDRTLSALEIWGNESQERHVLLIRPESLGLVRRIAQREGTPLAVVGTVTGDGQFCLVDGNDSDPVVDLPLDRVLGALPQKTFDDDRVVKRLTPFVLPAGVTVAEALDRVLRLPSVASKDFLTVKVDRSVTGLVAQQQCVGPQHVTLCDYAVIAQSHFGTTGIAKSLGEQPIKGLISPEKMARFALAEAVLNMAGAAITQRSDIKCSANWMLAAKQPGEGAWLYDAACSLRDAFIALTGAIDGGKDSLSMAVPTRAPDGTTHLVKAPGELVIAAYAPMPDLNRKVTPDFKLEGNAILVVDCGQKTFPLGGSALAQVYRQVGDDCPDVDLTVLSQVFDAVQELVKNREIVSVHDVSDGGLLTAVLEMAFAGVVGCTIDVNDATDPFAYWFSEEPRLVIECESADRVIALCAERGIAARRIGTVGESGGSITATYNGQKLLEKPVLCLRTLWHETSNRLDLGQANPDCVHEESAWKQGLATHPQFRTSYEAVATPAMVFGASDPPKVAVLREEGTNGDRELAAAFIAAGFEAWDVPMRDLIDGRITLDGFRGVAFPGGFSFADVLDAGKGWASVIRFNRIAASEFERFYGREDTFSLGICNGCQLMALLGWAPWKGLRSKDKPRFIRNMSDRFESRFPSVVIPESRAMMFSGMAGSILGVWVAHGEGRLNCAQELVTKLFDERMVAMQYVDHEGHPTMAYPFNPSGTIRGIAGVCSPDGRHLALMPHPERTFLPWQWPWVPERWKPFSVSPWLRMFQNAYDWCRA